MLSQVAKQVPALVRGPTFLTMMTSTLGAPSCRQMSVAYNLKSKFEEAYERKQEEQAKIVKKQIEPENKKEYGQGFYQQNLKSMKSGYVHPYHNEQNPLVFSHFHYMKTLFEAIGPEQVSPHYETLSRSRRGLFFVFLYIGVINTISRLGGWAHNEWLRGMIWHHEYLIAFYLGYIEIRHFTYFLGPKFTIFYNVYSRYETMQFATMWADTCEEEQMAHLRETKEQLEFARINKEYDFIKKRALVNFMTNEKLNVEQHFHNRALTMLKQIQNFEKQNLNNYLRDIVLGSFEAVTKQANDPANKQDIQESSFQSALKGIRSGSMRYEDDALLPKLQEEIGKRIEHFQGLSQAEESKLLQLTPEQRKVVQDNDKKAKAEYLSTPPNINNPGVKNHEKYQSMVNRVQSLAR